MQVEFSWSLGVQLQESNSEMPSRISKSMKCSCSFNVSIVIQELFRDKYFSHVLEASAG